MRGFCRVPTLRTDPGRAGILEGDSSRVLAVTGRKARLAAFGGQTTHFWPKARTRAAVCLLSQTRGRNRREAAVPTHGAGLPVRLLGAARGGDVWL